jgi:hypothetical protein
VIARDQRNASQPTALAPAAAISTHRQEREATGSLARQDRQTARRLVKRMTTSTQSPQHSAPQSAHTPAAGAWQYAQ